MQSAETKRDFWDRDGEGVRRREEEDKSEKMATKADKTAEMIKNHTEIKWC